MLEFSHTVRILLLITFLIGLYGNCHVTLSTITNLNKVLLTLRDIHALTFLALISEIVSSSSPLLEVDDLCKFAAGVWSFGNANCAPVFTSGPEGVHSCDSGYKPAL
jgi:hypothetical protein